MSDRYDVIVVGVGTFGSAACAELARRGARVLGLDRYGTPNSLGAHDAGPRVLHGVADGGEDEQADAESDAGECQKAHDR